MRTQALSLSFALLAVAAFAQPSSSKADSIVIIVNESNSVSHLTRAQLSRYFLKKVTTWADGRPLEPVDLGENARTREMFSSIILGKRVTAVKAYWQQMIFSGRAVPPPEKRSEEDVIEFVHLRLGAIGYVSSETDVGERVKIVRVVD